MVEIQQIKVWLNQQLKHCPSADITEPKVPSNTSKDKEESTTNQNRCWTS
ncbi:truncated FmtB protein [Staphylococcus aureus]|uniref:Truncated FmtB protein n=1 Tax=Staphylococcus aureus TaxID=1280 RepID=A0A380DW33_STAAU|nr:truncated FmtB protein [Staphylococcus aureus]